MLTVRVCVGSACHLKGSYNIINLLQRLVEEHGVAEKVTIKAALCLGNCKAAVSIGLGENENEVFSVNEGNVAAFFSKQVLSRLC